MGKSLERICWELAGIVGVNPQSLTLRELVWMATERRRFAGELAAWHLAGIVAFMPFTGQQLKPDEINPYRVEQPVSEAMKRLQKWKADRAWKAKFGSKKKDQQ